MRIVDSFEAPVSIIYSVEIAEGRFVDVKCFHNHHDFGNLIYVLQNHDGTMVYGEDGETYPHFPFPTQDVLLLCIANEREILHAETT